MLGELVGKSAEVMHGYQKAADIGQWRIAPRMISQPGQQGEEFFIFEGTIKQCNEFWLTQDPWEFRLPMGRTTWVWSDVKRIVRDGHTLHADLLGRPTIER